MHGAIPLLPNTPSWRGAKLKHTDNFTFDLYAVTPPKFEPRTSRMKRQSVTAAQALFPLTLSLFSCSR